MAELGGKPYLETTRENTRRRTFQSTVLEEDLVWHRDHSNRHIYILNGSDWKLQFDNELPFVLERWHTYYIPKKTYHRVIKGKGDLIIDITES